MNDNVKGMLFTAGAVVVGVLVASMVQSKFLDKMGSSPVSADVTSVED
tara:strand:+ start:83 stop:226 length:144 start_codon:yes stop_codon:yes gene_type:complete